MRCHYSRRPLLLGHKTWPCARCGAENAIGWNARSSARPRLRAPGVYGLTCAPRFSKFAVLRWMAPHDPASRQSYIFSINQSAPFVAQASVNKAEAYICPVSQDSLAERSKALAYGASPQGRGFEPHNCHIFTRPLHPGFTFVISSHFAPECQN